MGVEQVNRQVLTDLRWQSQAPVWSSGFAELDALLPGGGWPAGTLIELLVDHVGCGELSLLLPVLRLRAQESGWMHWINPPLQPYAPALASAGIGLDRLLEIRVTALKDQLWVFEQSLQSPICNTVLAWLDLVEPRWLRRLQLAAKTHMPLVVLLRQTRCLQERSPANVRLHLQPSAAGLVVKVVKAPMRALGQSVTLPLWQRGSGKI